MWSEYCNAGGGGGGGGRRQTLVLDSAVTYDSHYAQMSSFSCPMLQLFRASSKLYDHGSPPYAVHFHQHYYPTCYMCACGGKTCVVHQTRKAMILCAISEEEEEESPLFYGLGFISETLELYPTHYSLSASSC